MALSRIQKFIVFIIIAIIVLSVWGYLLYNYTGWKEFTMNKGDNFQITDNDPTLVEKLNFKDCVFSAKGRDGTVVTQKVTSVLNGMASAYAGNVNKGYVFKLDDDGLNVFSFQISNFNDKNVNPGSDNMKDNWIDMPGEPNPTVTLKGYYKLLN